MKTRHGSLTGLLDETGIEFINSINLNPSCHSRQRTCCPGFGKAVYLQSTTALTYPISEREGIDEHWFSLYFSERETYVSSFCALNTLRCFKLFRKSKVTHGECLSNLYYKCSSYKLRRKGVFEVWNCRSTACLILEDRKRVVKLHFKRYPKA